MDGSTSEGAGSPHLWRVGTVSFDEATRELRVAGARHSLENKPLALFLCLLRARGSLVTKAELTQAGWGRGSGSDQSLAVAISKLRRTFGEDERDLIEVVTNEGYRLTKPVTLSLSEPAPRPIFSFTAGSPVPGRPSWTFAAPLGGGQANNVWLATHVSTGERRVFKFADDPEQIDALRHELSASRRLQEIPDHTNYFVAILDADLISRPARIESADGGLDLAAWAEQQGGLAAIPLQTRLTIVAGAAEALARAHAVGVLHGDLQPGNILIREEHGSPRLRLADFGAGGLTEAALTELLSRSLQSVTFEVGPKQRGALLYLAPETGDDGRPTIPADIYALGILLYQMTVGEFGRPLTLQLEDKVPDPLLREDIVAAAADNPDARLKSAAELAERLRSLDQRRAERATRQRDRESEARRRRRQPFVQAVAATVFIGLIATGIIAWQEMRARDEAQRRAYLFGAVNRFLTEDLLGHGDPAVSGKSSVTLVEAAQDAEPMIDQRFGAEPQLAASLYIILTKVFESLGSYDASRKAYDRAEAILTRIEGAQSADVTILLLRRAAMEVLAGQPGSLEMGKSLIQRMEPHIGGLGPRALEARAWLLFAKGQLQILEGNMGEAYREFAEAVSISDAMPDAFDTEARLTMHDQEGFSLLKMGRTTEASAIYTRLVADQTELHGPLHPNTLRAALRLAETSILTGHPEVAVARFDALIPRLRLVFGPTSRKVVIALSARGDALLMLGRYDESERDALEGYRAASATLGEKSYFTFNMFERAGVAECRAGRTDDGLKKIQQAMAMSRTNLGDAHPITQLMRPDIALCLTLAGRAIEARPFLEGLDCAALSGFKGQPDLCTDIDVQQAAIEKASGNGVKARELLKKALGHYSGSPGDPFYKQYADTMRKSLPP